MNALLISDAPTLFPFSALVSHHLDTAQQTLLQVLNSLQQERDKYEILIVLAELVFRDDLRQNYGGLELLKHIRLSPELQPLNQKPIILLHWLDLEHYISRSRENIFLLSPGIYRKRLPIADLQFEGLIGLKENEQFSEYIFGSDLDKEMSDHTFRNKEAIAQFSSEEKIVIDKPLWYKKINYRLSKKSKILLDDTQNCINNPVHILLFDDMEKNGRLQLELFYRRSLGSEYVKIALSLII